jgi:hypothetical protein
MVDQIQGKAMSSVLVRRNDTHFHIFNKITLLYYYVFMEDL